MTTNQNEQNDSAKLKKLIKGISVAMLTTSELNGQLHSRPMETQELDENGNLWFFTSISSLKVSEIDYEKHVNVNYADPKKNSYVSVSGVATLVQDPIRLKELWTPAAQAWFPKGITDPDLGLLKISIESAEYWDSPASTVVKLIGFTKAFATGQRYAGSEHGRINFRPTF